MILGLILLLIPLSGIEKAGIANVNWQELFPNYVERIYVIMQDGVTFPHTSHDEAMVDMSIGRLEEKLRKIKGKNYSIKKIAIIIHNHQWEKDFSRSDYKQYWTLKGNGFDGRFLLYCHRTKEIYDIEDKTK